MPGHEWNVSRVFFIDFSLFLLAGGNWRNFEKFSNLGKMAWFCKEACSKMEGEKYL